MRAKLPPIRKDPKMPNDEPMMVELTKDERDLIFCLQYQIVGGAPHGPRKILSGLIKKFEGNYDANRFKAAYEAVNQLGGKAVVIRESP